MVKITWKIQKLHWLPQKRPAKNVQFWRHQLTWKGIFSVFLVHHIAAAQMFEKFIEQMRCSSFFDLKYSKKFATIRRTSWRKSKVWTKGWNLLMNMKARMRMEEATVVHIKTCLWIRQGTKLWCLCRWSWSSSILPLLESVVSLDGGGLPEASSKMLWKSTWVVLLLLPSATCLSVSLSLIFWYKWKAKKSRVSIIKWCRMIGIKNPAFKNVSLPDQRV